MIEFHLDPRSGVATYLQIVQQVKEALRLGLLDVGDQLPTVREVVADLAINPNTVAKAYRELEREGLVVARPGRGTFVSGTLAGALARAPRGAAPRAASAGSSSARQAGLDEESIRALSRRRSGRRSAPSGMIAALATDALGKRFGEAGRCATARSRSPRGRSPGSRPERRGQVDAARARRRRCCARREGEIAVLGRDPRRDPGPGADVGYVAEDAPLYRSFTVGDTLEFARADEPRAGTPRRRATSSRGCAADERVGALSAGAARAGRARASRSASGRCCCSSTSRSRASTRCAGREFLQLLMEGVAETARPS